MSTLVNEIKSASSRVFRRFFIKRKSLATGLFESEWQDVSDEVQTWGRVRKEIDSVRYGKITFSDLITKMDNSSGMFNPEDDESSLWFGYGSQQRTLVRVEAGFISSVKGDDGIWTNTEFPAQPEVFHGIISGDIPLSDQNIVSLPVRPLLQIFRDFPARNLSGFTSTGLSASQFMTMVRDQTDGSGNFLFRPFFGDTTSAWNITPTTDVYANLNTATAEDVYDKTVWDIMEKLLEAENMVVYIRRDGSFNFTPRDATTTVAFQFSGAGFVNNEYGHTIKRVSRYGKKQTDYFSRVEVKFRQDDTYTSFRVREATLTVSGVNDPWNRGAKTYQFENLWVANTLAADVILEAIYDSVTVLKNQIEFTASFVPHLEVLDRVRLSYDSGDQDPRSRWDSANWAAPAVDAEEDLIWAKVGGDAIRLVNSDFKILSVELDLEKLETKISGITA